MKDTPHPHILSKFQPKIWKFLVIGTCPKSLYSQKTQSSPLGVNPQNNYNKDLEVKFNYQTKFILLFNRCLKILIFLLVEKCISIYLFIFNNFYEKIKL